MPQAGYFWMGNSGCLLPFLIIFNLFFGRMILGSTGLWLGLEAILVLIFILKVRLMVSRISRQLGRQDRHTQTRSSQDRVVDIHGQVVDDEE